MASLAKGQGERVWFCLEEKPKDGWGAWCG
jgi:hypothetical protein